MRSGRASAPGDSAHKRYLRSLGTPIPTGTASSRREDCEQCDASAVAHLAPHLLQAHGLLGRAPVRQRRPQPENLIYSRRTQVPSANRVSQVNAMLTSEMPSFVTSAGAPGDYDPGSSLSPAAQHPSQAADAT